MKRLTGVIELKDGHFRLVVELLLEIGDVRGDDAGVVGRVQLRRRVGVPDGQAADAAEQREEQQKDEFGHLQRMMRNEEGRMNEMTIELVGGSGD